MDYIPKLRTEPEVNLIDIIWGLLSQWKAVFAAAIIMALLLSGFKYYRDNKAYEASLKNQEEIEAMASLSPDEQISNILEKFSDDDRVGVEYVVNQKEWVAKEKRYLRDSILMNTDPTNQRTLILDYFIYAPDASDATMSSLAYGYLGFANGEGLITALKQIIDPEKETSYISELVTVKNNYSDGLTKVSDSVVEIQIVLPDNVDADEVKEAVSAEMKKYSEKIKAEVGPHDMRLLNASDSTLYNAYAVDRKTNINVTIYNMSYNLGNLESALSEEQRIAMNSILEINRKAREAENAVAAEEPAVESSPIVKPGISKKFAVLGFLMGVILYAMAYILYSAIKGNITSAEQTEHYSGSRLLGELYYNGDNEGIQWLMHSRVVDSLRYRGKTDIAKQISKITATVDAICKKNEINQITALCLPGITDGDRETINNMIASISEKGVNVEQIGVDYETIEEKLLSTNYAICMTNKEGRAADLINLSELCNVYDTKMLGNVFVGCI